MAVPKKKMSKSKTNSRKFSWENKIAKKVIYAISLGKSYKKKNKMFPLDIDS